MAKHIFRGQTPPTFAPRQVGHHYVDEAAKITYISVGISSPSDWVMLNSASAMPVIKSGKFLNSAFAGNPKKVTVTFTTPFSTNNYSVTISGVDVRIFVAESKTINGFIINTNANLPLTGDVFWDAIENGEFV